MNETTRRAWRKGAIGFMGVALIFAVIVAGVNMTGAPLNLARAVATAIEKETGWQIEVRGAHLAGLSQLRLTEVAIRDGADGFDGRLPVVDVTVDPWQLLTARSAQGAIDQVRLVRPRIVVKAQGGPAEAQPWPRTRDDAAPRGQESPEEAAVTIRLEVVDGTLEEADANGETVRAWRVDGRADVSVGGQGIVAIKELRVKQVGENAELILRQDRSAEPAAYRFEARGPAEFLLPLAGFDRWQITGDLTAHGELEFAAGMPVAGGLKAGKVAAEVSAGAIAWGEGSLDRADFDSLTLDAEGDGREWRIASLTLRRAGAMAGASGTIALAPQGGTSALDLSVNAESLELPKDIPILGQFGVSGEGAFSGRVSGDLNEPVLSGTLSVVGGTVWRRPVARGEGHITLASDRFIFNEVNLEKGTARYVLGGEVRWDQAPQQLSIELEAVQGSVAELLQAFDIKVDAEGIVDGKLHFAGSPGAIRLSGDAAVREARIGGIRYFDQAQGRFGWQDGVLTLAGVRARNGEGEAAVDGVLTAGQLDLAVALNRWPLQAGSGPLATLASGVSGWVSYEGRLEGSVEAPRLSGRFAGGDLELGRLRASAPVGEAHFTLDAVELSGVTIVSAGSGRYRLDGVVQGWRTSTPNVELDVTVEEASLAGLLRESGMGLPALLLDGQVSGTMKVRGDARRPDTTFDLALGDELGVGEPIRLEFGFEDGRLKLGRSALMALMGA